MSVEMMSQCWRLDLPQNKKLVLLAIADHANDEGIAWPSQGRIAWKTGYSRRNIKRILDELVDDGYLKVLRIGRGRGTSSVHQLTLDEAPELPKYNADDYYIPFKQKVTPATPNTVKGDITGKKVTSATIKGDIAVSPEPSIEPSIELPSPKSGEDAPPPASKPNGKNQARSELEDHFCFITGIPKPKDTTTAQRKAAGVRWWNPLRDILDVVGWDIFQAKRLVDNTYGQMRADELTIATPQSILSVAVSLAAAESRPVPRPTPVQDVKLDLPPTIFEEELCQKND